LWYAAAAGSVPVVDVLLAVRAKPEGADRDGNDPGERPLLAAIRAGSDAVVLRLLAAGAAVDARSANQQAPLRVAADAGQTRIVALLLERRPQVDAVDAFGDTALMAAARIGDLDICLRLLQAGANPRLRNRERATAADLAEARGFAILAQRLRS
jgi:ankyrin repeat protein